MGQIQDAIKRYKLGEREAINDIIQKMNPLIKKISYSIHFMEPEDTTQELLLSIINVIPKLDEDKSEGEYVRYLEVTLNNAYKKLCTKYLNRNIETIVLDETQQTSSTDKLSDLIFEIDFYTYLQRIMLENKRNGDILRLSILEHMPDSKIALIFNLSRQHVHRIRKSMIMRFFHEEGVNIIKMDNKNT